MKDKHKSKKHKRGHDEYGEDRYSNILKEKHYKDEYNSKKDIKSFSKHKSPEKEHQKFNKSPERCIEQKRGINHSKNHRKEDINEESYEELSRKKRRIESELQALDLEEAEAKKQKRDRKREKEHPDKRKEEPTHKKEHPVRVKEEPIHKKEHPVRVKEEPAHKKEHPVRVKEESTHKKEHPVRMKEEPPHKKEHPIRVKEERTANNEKSTRPSRSHNRIEAEDKSKSKEVFGKPGEEAKVTEKEKPNFEVSGNLAEDTNVYNGVVIKYNEPSEARKPQRRWRLYPFKGESDLPFIPIHRQSAYLFGRTRSIADIPIDHPSCSKQHAVLQFRLVPYTREDGTKGRRVRPYIIDLESSNGTFVNNKRIQPRCYVELIEKDVIKFGYSSREYVILHEESKEDAIDDDVIDSN